MHVYYNTVQGSIFTDSQIGPTYLKNAITLNHTIKNHPRVHDAMRFLLIYSSAQKKNINIESIFICSTLLHVSYGGESHHHKG